VDDVAVVELRDLAMQQTPVLHADRVVRSAEADDARRRRSQPVRRDRERPDRRERKEDDGKVPRDAQLAMHVIGTYRASPSCARASALALERRAIPFPQIGCGLVRAAAELQERFLRVAALRRSS